MRLLFGLIVGFLLQIQNSSAQFKYSQNYFRNPLGIPLQLAANFGELRTNHFHMGLDIRTQGRENLPVYAAADGYVSRVKIEKWGYGKAIYITHPNGYVTLYAHLNSFYSELEKFIKEKQYEEQSWEQDVELEPGEFPISKGQFIALSGNSGASAGPHLHFEIRDAETENNLNPLLFGLGIPDRLPPVIKKLFLYDRRFSTYEATPKQIALKAGGGYHTQAAVVKTNSPVVSFGITTEDKTSNSPFWFGIYQAELWMDDTLLHAFQLDDFSYDDTRYVNACIDYSKYIKERIYIQHLSTLPGNRLNIFTEAGANGVIVLQDTLPHKVHINIKDANGNAARLTTMLQFDGSSEHHSNRDLMEQQALPNYVNHIEKAILRLDFPEYSFYDTVPFIIHEQTANTSNAASAKISLPNYIPVHDSFMIQLKTTLAKNDPLRNNVVMFFTNGSSKDAMKGTWNGDFMATKFKRLCNVQLVIDKIPPAIKPIGWKDGAKLSALKTIRFRCTDELDEVATFTATLENGQWLLFSKKNDDFSYTFDEYCPPGRHQLTVTVTDKAGNETTKVFSFAR